MTTDAVQDGTAELYEALRSSPAVGPWVFQAACAGLELFGTLSPQGDPEHLSAAGRVCANCDVLEDCRSYAEGAPTWGVWGGRAWDGTTSRSVLPVVHRAA